MIEAVSRGYKNILNHFHKKGREYADGFSEADFSGLSEDEERRVSDELEIRAAEGDTVAISGISYLDDSLALKTFDRLLNTNDLKKSAVAQILFEAFEISKAEVYLKQLLSIVDGIDQREKWLPVQLLCNIDYGDEWSTDIEEMFIDLLRKETDSTLKHSVAQRILAETGIGKGSAEYKRLIMLLISPNNEDLDKGVFDLKNSR